MPSVRVVLLLAVTPCVLAAQDSSEVDSSARLDTGTPPVTFGVTSGAMRFADDRVQQGVTGVLRYHFGGSVSLSASPTFARVMFPSALGGGSVNGFTDLPIELDADHSFDGPWSPTIGVALGASMPLGDQQIGFGSGSIGADIGAGVGASPIDGLSIHLGAGKPLTDYSAAGALGASGSAWTDAEMSWQLQQHFTATLGYDGDLEADDSLGVARAVALSLAAMFGSGYTVTVSGGHGVSGPAARWTFALGIGTDFASLEALGSSSPIQRFFRAMGGGSRRASGSTPGSGHGRAP